MTLTLSQLDKVGLLVGGHVRPPAQPVWQALQGRTCIDGGHSTLITLCSSGKFGFALPQSAADGLQHWRRGCFQTEHRGTCLLVTSATKTARTKATTHIPIRSAFAKDRITKLAAFGQVYMATDMEPETGDSWLSFMLHPRQPLRPVLAALDAGAIWPVLRDMISDAMMRPITDALRPWSVAIAASSGRIRIGTTAFGRITESQSKARALVNTLQSFGHDCGQAAAVYSLAQRAAANITKSSRTGVAVEFDLDETTLNGAMFTLRLQD